MIQSTWKYTRGRGEILNFRENYQAMIKGDGYQVRQYTEDIGMGDNFFASMRCAPIGDPSGYPTYGKAILACLEYAGLPNRPVAISSNSAQARSSTWTFEVNHDSTSSRSAR